ncbi:MAG TPA: acyl-CoA reductase [Saprospiraceae bacterium]|nr:acyl-CoA reductase [Saprospiraceae bacterium]
MTLQEKIKVLVSLGAYLLQYDERLQAHVHRASIDNPWFTLENIRYALNEIAGRMLNENALLQWTKSLKTSDKLRRVGVIMAGNIPVVGFHDLLCVFMSGNISVIKLSEKDKYLIPFMIKILEELDPRTSRYFEIVDKLTDIDAVIATGSNNSARYFEYYFAKYPHIIRRNRNAVAILDGKESDDELSGLCDDIFIYFGLGCRSVSHCFVPAGYDFTRLIEQMKRYEPLSNHNKYRNNLDYNMALQMLNKIPHIAVPNLILLENATLISPVGCLYYSFYQNKESLYKQLQLQCTEIQCVVTNHDVSGLPCIRFGKAQQPALDDYADGIDTLAFLQNLNS